MSARKLRVSLRFVLCSGAVLVLVSAIGCGGHKAARQVPFIGSGGQPDGLANLQAAEESVGRSLDDTLGELDAYPCPEGVDEELWGELKDALEEALQTELTESRPGSPARLLASPEEQDGHSMRCPYKWVSIAPTGEANRVDDLAYSDDGEGNLVLTWHYQNLGDYDQNGVVGLPDIYPLAEHFGESYEPEDANCIQAVVDGSCNYAVDIADITPLAMNFGTDCAEYAVQHAASVDGEFTETARVPLPEVADDERLLLSSLHTLDAEKPFVRVVPYDGEGNDGVPSEAIEIPCEAPHISTIYPRFGVAGTEVTFSAAIQGIWPFTYSWDFGGGAEPNVSDEPMPTVTLAAEGEYNANLTVSNLIGSDECAFLLTCGTPPEVVEVTPTQGDSGDLVKFSAVVTGTEPITCAWDFGGGAEPNVSDDTSPTVVLGEAGDYAASVTASSQYGVDTREFALIVYGVRAWQAHLKLDGAIEGLGLYTSLAVVNGSPAISYTGDQGCLRYIRATGAGGIAWEDFVTPDSESNVGYYTSLAVVDGKPAISYCDLTNKDLKYVRATDADGNDWGEPVTVDSEGNVGWYTSLAVVEGNPAISYTDYDNGDLKYVRATDADGSEWGEPVILDEPGVVGWCTSLAVVNGKPAVSYCDITPFNLNYVRANDATGSDWGYPVTVDSEGNVGWNTSLTVVNGNPAIAYYDYTNFDLKYVRASDSDGNAWGEPVIPDSAGNVGYYTSLAVVDGNPAIAYHDGDKRDLKYVRARDVNGASWKTPVTVDVDGGEHTSLAVVNGNPAISYKVAGCLMFTIGLRE